MFGRGEKLVPLLVLVVIGLACFARLVADPAGLIVDGRRPSLDFANRGDPRPLGNDLTFVFWPHHLQVAKVLREFGHFPLWDSSGFGGRPMVGNPQCGLFYPPAWIVWYFCTPSTLCWLTAGHLLWGGLGLYLLARGQGLGQWPATVAAGAFQASPYLLAQAFEGHHPHVWAACWFPWAFWAFAEYRTGRLRGLLTLPPILTFTCLTGHPQEWFLLVTALSLWVGADLVINLFKTSYSIVDLAKYASGWPGILALCIAMAAIEIVPAAAVLPWVQFGPQGEAIPAIARSYQVHLVNVLQLLSPSALGGPHDYFGHDNYWESVLSFGLVTLVLAAAGTVLCRDRPRVRVWLSMVLLATWYAAGRQLGLFTALCWIVPGMSWFRVPARSLFLASVGVAVLAGFGVQALQEQRHRVDMWRQFAVRLAGIGLLVFGSLLLLHGLGTPGTDRPQSSSKNGDRVGRATGRILTDPPFWTTSAMLGLVVGLGVLDRRGTTRSLAVQLLGLLALGELAWHGVALMQVAPAKSLARSDPISETLILLDPSLTEREPFRVRARDTFFLDLDAARYDIEKTNTNDLFQLGHAAALYETLYPIATRPPQLPDAPMSQAVEEHLRRVRQGVFDRMAVVYLVSDRVEADPPWPVVATGNRDGKTYVIQRNPTAMPRAYIVPRAEVVDEDPALVLSRFRSSDPREAVLMTGDPLAGLPSAPRQPFTPVRWLCRDPDRPILEVSTEAPGLLVIADTWMPGWSASVNRQTVPILRGNHAQRVIALAQPGRHTITLNYRPPGLALGLIVSVLSTTSWFALCALALARRHRRRQVAASPPIHRTKCALPAPSAPPKWVRSLSRNPTHRT